MKKNRTNLAILISIMLIVATITLIIGFLLRGKTTVTGNFPDPVSSDSIICEGDNIEYPYFKTSTAEKTTTRITSTFTDGKLSSVSMVYSLFDDNSSTINNSESANHARINLATQADGLGSDIFNLHFSKLADRLEARFYAEAKDINNVSSKYLMLEPLSDNNAVYSKNFVQKNYEAKGLKCLAENK